MPQPVLHDRRRFAVPSAVPLSDPYPGWLSSPLGRSYLHGCLGKRRHRDEHYARRSVAFIRSRGVFVNSVGRPTDPEELDVYRCSHCGYYHIGNQRRA